VDKASEAAVSGDSDGFRLGPLQMCSGVRGTHVGALFFVAFFSVPIVGFVGLVQPFVLTEILKIPFDEQGSLTGNILVLHELINLSLIGVYGAASDRLGRRSVLSTALLLVAAGYCLFPIVTGKYELVLFRVVVACGVGGITAMITAVANDYPLERYRARMIAAVFMFNGVGLAILPRIFGGLPAVFTNQGYDASAAAGNAFLVVAGVAIVVAIASILGLRKGAPRQIAKDKSIVSTLAIGFRAVRNPRIALAYGAAMVSRGDLSVASTFLTLWLVTEGVKSGLSAAEALKNATLIYIIIQASALPWAPVLGYILDRVDRLYGVMVAMLIAAVGYGSFVLLEDPLSNWIYPCAALVGMGEMAALLSATSLIGQEAPIEGRGAVMGVFSMFGAAGIMSVGLVGGFLFDNWQPTGPFALVASANVVLFVAAGLLLLMERKQQG
jgi:MFS family permease